MKSIYLLTTFSLAVLTLPFQKAESATKDAATSAFESLLSDEQPDYCEVHQFDYDGTQVAGEIISKANYDAERKIVRTEVSMVGGGVIAQNLIEEKDLKGNLLQQIQDDKSEPDSAITLNWTYGDTQHPSDPTAVAVTFHDIQVQSGTFSYRRDDQDRTTFSVVKDGKGGIQQTSAFSYAQDGTYSTVTKYANHSQRVQNYTADNQLLRAERWDSKIMRSLVVNTYEKGKLAKVFTKMPMAAEIDADTNYLFASEDFDNSIKFPKSVRAIPSHYEIYQGKDGSEKDARHSGPQTSAVDFKFTTEKDSHGNDRISKVNALVTSASLPPEVKPEVVFNFTYDGDRLVELTTSTDAVLTHKILFSYTGCTLAPDAQPSSTRPSTQASTQPAIGDQ